MLYKNQNLLQCTSFVFSCPITVPSPPHPDGYLPFKLTTVVNPYVYRLNKLKPLFENMFKRHWQCLTHCFLLSSEEILATQAKTCHLRLTPHRGFTTWALPSKTCVYLNNHIYTYNHRHVHCCSVFIVCKIPFFPSQEPGNFPIVSINL